MKIEILIPPIDPTAMIPAWTKITYTEKHIEGYDIHGYQLTIRRKDGTKTTYHNVQFIITE